MKYCCLFFLIVLTALLWFPYGKLPHYEVKDWAQIITAMTALFAVIVSTLLQWGIASKQIASNISTKRQVWIDELRKEFSELLTAIGRIEELKRPHPLLAMGEQKKMFDEKTDVVIELSIRIKLRLNPNENDHNELVKLMDQLQATCIDPQPNETPELVQKVVREFISAKKNVINHMQLILKKEWERVKTRSQACQFCIVAMIIFNHVGVTLLCFAGVAPQLLVAVRTAATGSHRFFLRRAHVYAINFFIAFYTQRVQEAGRQFNGCHHRFAGSMRRHWQRKIQLRRAR